MPTRRRVLQGIAGGAVAAAVPLKHALALSPPYDFSTFTSTSKFKLFGGNILQVPSYFQTTWGMTNQPGGDYAYGGMFQQFSTGANCWTNWIQPQIANYQRRGANHVRCILGGDYVLQGTITQGALNTAVNTILADIRSRGMTINFDMMAVQFLSDIGSPTATAQWAVSQSILDNCIVPNLDIVAYFQPSNQEARGSTDQGVANSVYGLMKGAGYVTPIGANPFGGTFNNYTLANFDLMCIHNYIAQSTGNYYEGMRSTMISALSTYNKKAMMEEYNTLLTSSPNPGEMANALEQTLMAVFGLSDVVGSTVWGGQSIAGQTDGDFSLYTVPGSYNPEATDPTTVWTNNTAGTTYFLWGCKNISQTFKVSANGTPSITTSLTAIQLNLTTPIQGQTLTNQSLGTSTRETVVTSCIGTVTVSGTGGNTYRVSYGWTNFNTSVRTEVGHVDIVGSGTATIDAWGTFAAGVWVPDISTQVVVGSTSGTLSSVNVTIQYGVAPIPTPSLAFVR